MKAAVLYAPGPPDAFRYEEVADPEPKPGEVLVRVEVVSIEGGDTLHRALDPIPNPPAIVGYQCAGTVIGLVASPVEYVRRADGGWDTRRRQGSARRTPWERLRAWLGRRRP